MKWNRHTDHTKDQGDTEYASKTEAQTSQDVCLKNGDKVSYEGVEIYPGL
jgi:hypothetical protein